MSQTASNIDLSQLAVDRTRPAPPTMRRRTPWLTRYALPAIILGGFVALFGWSTRDSFLSAQPVTIVPVTISRAEIKQAGTPLFQAAGWIEPRPTAVVASSLAPGVIKDLLVVEGDRVELGQPVAMLIDTDAKLVLAEAKSLHAIQLGELERAKATLMAARINLEQPVKLRAELGDAEAMLAETQRELNNLPYAIEAARTKLQLMQENTRRKEKAGDAIMGRLLREARGEQALAEGSLNELIAREPTLRSQLDSLTRKKEAIAAQLNLLTEEKRALADAEANLKVLEARVQQTQLAVQTAELQLDRMIVRSPIAGCVLSLEARPGQWLSGMGNSSSQGSSAVVSLYDPHSLQVRVDVRLEDVPQVIIGQPAQIESAALPKAIAGKVISVTTQADIQKNTLQVKVAIIEPPTVIKPEMLAKVTFVAPPTPEQEGVEQTPPVRTFVPQSLLAQGEAGHSVWVVDLAQGTASRRSVTVGQAMTEGNMVEIVSGLSPTDKLIVGGRESLSEGARVRVSSEAPSNSGV
ncbi:efflux RND transporter periplasmic adaptor subunit [Aeoliella sp. SH292]|uniref:efflux RND transporter periplasmic adaptor subunit n=1 Tax=Aeoliella sp. SH292 TaxID=3454464 RepID=UPI003F9C8BE8